MRLTRTLAMALLLTAIAARSARADVTAFIGANTTPSNRPVKGFAFGVSLIVIGFEFEYSATNEDIPKAAPSLDTYMGNVLLQTPIPIFGFQPYFTTGGGGYRETLVEHKQTSVGTNVGGGVKVSLVGPLKIRLDYRLMKLGSSALNSPAHRFYAGVNLNF
jgi:hypothetical protein